MTSGSSIFPRKIFHPRPKEQFPLLRHERNSLRRHSSRHQLHWWPAAVLVLLVPYKVQHGRIKTQEEETETKAVAWWKENRFARAKEKETQQQHWRALLNNLHHHLHLVSKSREEQLIPHHFHLNGVSNAPNHSYHQVMELYLIHVNVNVIEAFVGSLHGNFRRLFTLILMQPLMLYTRLVCFCMMQYNQVVNDCREPTWLVP